MTSKHLSVPSRLFPVARARGRHSLRFLLTWRLAALAGAILVGALVFAQASPHVAAVDPSSGKMNDAVTVTGENLGKGSVSAIFLSDAKSDYKATIAEQSEAKIVMKVPQVKAGDYNLSVQQGDQIYILPLRFKVAE